MRIKKLLLSPELLKEMINHPAKAKCIVPLPNDARIIRAYFDDRQGDAASNFIILVIESNAFEDIPEGTVIPNANVSYSRL